jgi:hypothetical protein
MNFIASHLRRARIAGLNLAFLALACSGDDPRLTPESLPPGATGAAYDATVRVRDLGGTPRWSIEAGTLPPGLEGSADGARFRITGTPVTPGSFRFSLRAASDDDVAERLYLLVIRGDVEPLQITTTRLPEATVGLAYEGLLTASGGSTSGYVWSADRLPAGLELQRAGAQIARVFGTPTEVGESEVVFTVTDDELRSATATLTLVVRDVAASLEIVTTELPGAVRGQQYSAPITAQGGTGQGYTWAATVLPQGLALRDGTPSATLQGRPVQEEPGQIATLVTVTDSGGNTAERNFTLTVSNPPTLVISPTQFPDGEVDVPYAQHLSAVGGVGPYSWSISAGSLPTDVALEASDALTATVAGTPSEPGTFNFTIQIEDDLGTTAELPVELFIEPAPLVLPSAAPPTGTAGVAYSATIEAEGGAAPFAWSIVAGALPPGLSLVPSNRNEVTVSGTPLAGGTFDATFQIADDLGATAERPFSFVIAPSPNPLMITTSSLADGVVNRAYVENIDATGGTGFDHQWRVAAGQLPPGLQLEATTGTISTTLLFGRPTAEGTFDFTIEVQDSAGSVDQMPYTVTATTP